MPDYEGKSELRKAAARRLSDAVALLDDTLGDAQGGIKRGAHLRGAVYLAGYTVECMLKVYIIDRQHTFTLTTALDRLRAAGVDTPNILGAEGHNLIRLLQLTDLEGMLAGDFRLRKAWGVCLRWRSTWRYAPDEPNEEFARDFLESAATLYRWVERQI